MEWQLLRPEPAISGSCDAARYLSELVSRCLLPLRTRWSLDLNYDSLIRGVVFNLQAVSARDEYRLSLPHLIHPLLRFNREATFPYEQQLLTVLRYVCRELLDFDNVKGTQLTGL